MSTYITTHNSEGKAVFSNEVPVAHHEIPRPKTSVKCLWTVSENPPDVSTDADMKAYAYHRTNMFEPGYICPRNGSSVLQLTMKPGAVSPMHRTVTLDVIVGVQDVVELRLDSGETRTIHPGDVVVQRGTMHEWTNVTPDNGEAKILAIVYALAGPIQIDGKTLEAVGL